jgi:hypothetical protein
MPWVRVPPEPLFENSSVLVEQPGVLACLSRRRSRVQIPSRTLAARYANWLSGEAQTFVSAGSTPACATDRVVLSAAVCRTVVSKQAEWMTRGSIPSRPTERPVRLSVQDTSLSSWKGGFDSRTGHSWPSGVIGGHRPKVGRRDAQNVVPLRRGSSSLPLVTEMLAGKNPVD